MYEIRLALETDYTALVEFIGRHWKKGHIFVTCKELLDWQHFDPVRGGYNFVLGIEKQTQDIHGVLGFIPLAKFDPEIEPNRLCWMVIWKTIDAARGQKLGRRILSYLEDTMKPNILSTVAASSMTLPIYQARGYITGLLDHYYILNPEKTDFRIANIREPRSRTQIGIHKADKRLARASERDIVNEMADCFLAQSELPHKSPTFLINRYLRHPIYQYQVYRILEGTKNVGIIVTRVCSHEGSRAIRIVDFIGPSKAVQGMRNQWIGLLKHFDAEYIDFYCTGINTEDLTTSGFNLRQAGDETIIPNYFEPFLRKNIEIAYMVHPGGQAYRIVKGDSDQDRPNMIESCEHE